MRIGFISDLHADINRDYPLMELLAEEAGSRHLDVLAIAGDISETPAFSLAWIRDLASRLEDGCGCRLYYVPGNHDLWNKNCTDRTADAIYEDYCRDPRCLSGRYTVLGGKGGSRIFLMGDTGWYDYSFAGKDYTKDQLDQMTLGGRTWQDRKFNIWTEDNAGRTEWFHQRLRQTAASCRAQMGDGDRLVILTHMLPRREFCVPAQKPGWDYFNAFLGSASLADEILQAGACISVCGHVHYRASFTESGVRWICPCLGTFDEWPLFGLGQASCAEHIRNALAVAAY